jgi:hypothetical protein
MEESPGNLAPLNFKKGAERRLLAAPISRRPHFSLRLELT